MTLHIKGIKCDQKGCNYLDASVLLSEYEDYIDKECPKCSSNLLTKEDYESLQFMIALDKAMDAEEITIPTEITTQEGLMSWVKTDNIIHKVHYHMKGDGSVTQECVTPEYIPTIDKENK